MTINYTPVAVEERTEPLVRGPQWTFIFPGCDALTYYRDEQCLHEYKHMRLEEVRRYAALMNRAAERMPASDGDPRLFGYRLRVNPVRRIVPVQSLVPGRPTLTGTISRYICSPSHPVESIPPHRAYSDMRVIEEVLSDYSALTITRVGFLNIKVRRGKQRVITVTDLALEVPEFLARNA